MYSILQVVVHVGVLFIFSVSLQRQSQGDEMQHVIHQKFCLSTVAHITDCAQLCKNENERFEAQFIMYGTIGLACSARSPLALCIQPHGACVAGVHRDKSFEGHGKDAALGKILCYCG